MSQFSCLDDAKLLQTARELVKAERELTAQVLACLEEVDRRRSYERSGYASFFDYCVRELGYSESAAGRRVAAVRASRKVPELISYVGNGELTLEAAAIAAPAIIQKPSEALAILEAVKDKPLREVERIVADRAPKAGPRDSIRPLGNDRWLFSFEAGADLKTAAERARDLSRHRFPDGRLEHVLAEGLILLLERIDRELKKPAKRPQDGVANPGNLPEWVRDEVYKRDGGRCVWPVGDGNVCGSTAWLEFDHMVPRAMGGTNDPSNVRVLCRAHNQYSARALGLTRPGAGA